MCYVLASLLLILFHDALQILQFLQSKHWIGCCCMTVSPGVAAGTADCLVFEASGWRRASRDTRDLSEKKQTSAEMKRRLQAAWKSLYILATAAVGLFPFLSGWLSLPAISQESPNRNDMEKGKESKELIGLQDVGGSYSDIQFRSC